MKAIKILKINWIEGFKISVVFSGYEGSRVIDFTEILKKLTADKDSPASILLDPKEFKKVKISDYTLSWDNVELYFDYDGQKERIPFDISPDILLKHSLKDESASNLNLKIAKLLKEYRKQLGLTQQDLAYRSGTTKHYISRIENNKSSIDLSTVDRIFSVGLGKDLEVSVK
jgi:DNA-binding XRE family transcriptional regulator